MKVIYEVTGMKGNVLMFKINRDTIVFLSFIQRTYCAKMYRRQRQAKCIFSSCRLEQKLHFVTSSPISFYGSVREHLPADMINSC